MTRNEATERAQDLWGNHDRTLTLYPAKLSRGCWHIEEWRAPNRLLIDRHYLDANGHTDCHEKCLQREAYLACRVGGNG